METTATVTKRFELNKDTCEQVVNYTYGPTWTAEQIERSKDDFYGWVVRFAFNNQGSHMYGHIKCGDAIRFANNITEQADAVVRFNLPMIKYWFSTEDMTLRNEEYSEDELEELSGENSLIYEVEIGKECTEITQYEIWKGKKEYAVYNIRIEREQIGHVTIAVPMNSSEYGDDTESYALAEAETYNDYYSEDIDWATTDTDYDVTDEVATECDDCMVRGFRPVNDWTDLD